MGDDNKSGQDQPNPDDKKTALGTGGKADDTGDGKKADDGKQPPADGKKDDGKKPGDGSDDQGNKDDTGKPASKVPEKYSLTRPDDALFTDEEMARYEARGKTLGLTNEQLQAVVDGDAADLAAIGDRFDREAKADKEIGGAKYDSTLALAHKGLRAFLSESPQEEQDAIIGLLETSRYGNHKALIRAFARLGKQVREDSPDAGGKGGGKADRTTEEILYGKR